MDPSQFQTIHKVFHQSDTDGKIALYVAARGLTQAQYAELLQMFPASELDKLEKALQ